MQNHPKDCPVHIYLAKFVWLCWVPPKLWELSTRNLDTEENEQDGFVGFLNFFFLWKGKVLKKNFSRREKKICWEILLAYQGGETIWRDLLLCQEKEGSLYSLMSLGCFFLVWCTLILILADVDIFSAQLFPTVKLFGTRFFPFCHVDTYR